MNTAAAGIAAILIFGAHGAAHAQGDPVAGARQVVAKVRGGGVKNKENAFFPKAYEENFTNEAAAGFGLMFYLGVRNRVEQLQKSAPVESGAQKAKRLQTLAQASQYKEVLEGVLRDHGWSGKLPDAGLWSRIKPRGRVMLEKMWKIVAQIGFGYDVEYLFKGVWGKNGSPVPDYRYKVLSPVRVVLLNMDGKAGSLLEARYEAGRWRLHFPFEKIMFGR